LASERGDTLIEVLISAILVALIVVATFNGFDAVNRASAEQRYHGEATVLAAQSQEQLRTDAAETLDELQSIPHVYTQTVGGTTYKITEQVYFVNDSQKSSGCSAVGGGESKSHGDYVEIVSSVTWPQLLKAKRPAVSQFSYITPPTGSALEVDVTNGGKPELPVAGVTAKVNEAEAVTGASGCLIFGGIPSTTVSVEVHKLGYVEPSGAFNVVSKEVSVAPNVIIHYPVTLAEGGKITAEFTYKGKATYEFENIKHEKFTEPVKGDTFVVHNAEMGVAPEFEAGSTKGKFNKESEYEVENSTYATSATTPAEPAHYPYGDLFPFTSSWAAYAGDCPENDAKKQSEKNAVEDGKGVVTAGGNVKVTVPMVFVKLDVWTGTESGKKETLAAIRYPVKITNIACTGSIAEPNNEPPVSNVHTQETLTLKEQEKFENGMLPDPFQPFGEFKLCLYNAAAKKTYTASYEDETEKGPAPNIYLGAKESYTEGAGALKVKVVVAEKQETNTC